MEESSLVADVLIFMRSLSNEKCHMDMASICPNCVAQLCREYSMSAVNFVLIFRANTTLRALYIHLPHAANTTRTQRDEDTHCEEKCITLLIGKVETALYIILK